MTVEPSVAPEPSRHPPKPPQAAGAVAVPAGLDWVSRLPSAAAPGFVYLAGACHGVPVGGGGRDLAGAAARLAGETAEVMAQLGAPCPSDAPGDPAIDAAWTAALAPLRVAATGAGGRPVGVPAAAIFLDGRAAAERAATAPPASLGLAAGPDPAAARLAALLELIERDAAAGWWNEGAAPRQLDAGAAAGAGAALGELRAGAAAPRATGFLVLPSRFAVPVVCALSRDADGSGLALGLKAALDPAAAAMGAMLELLQMELALEMARHRAARTGAAAGDHGPLARAALVPEDFAAFAAAPPAAAVGPLAAGFADLAAQLAANGVVVTVADVPAPPGGLAVAKVFAPALRPLPGGRPAGPGTPGAVAALM
jgi:ribosomal protein S12 methylthiotransferase accessory factor YcaO